MTAQELYLDMVQRGFQFHQDGNNLHIRGVSEPLTSELIQQLRHYKPKILSYLNSIRSNIRSIHVTDAIKLFRERGWIQIFSTHLNQSVYLVKDDSIRVPNNSIPRYTRSEAEALMGLSLKEIITLHVFKGNIC